MKEVINDTVCLQVDTHGKTCCARLVYYQSGPKLMGFDGPFAGQVVKVLLLFVTDQTLTRKMMGIGNGAVTKLKLR